MNLKTVNIMAVLCFAMGNAQQHKMNILKQRKTSTDTGFGTKLEDLIVGWKMIVRKKYKRLGKGEVIFH